MTEETAHRQLANQIGGDDDDDVVFDPASAKLADKMTGYVAKTCATSETRIVAEAMLILAAQVLEVCATARGETLERAFARAGKFFNDWAEEHASRCALDGAPSNPPAAGHA
jgi:hypothetical protein